MTRFEYMSKCAEKYGLPMLWKLNEHVSIVYGFKLMNPKNILVDEHFFPMTTHSRDWTTYWNTSTVDEEDTLDIFGVYLDL